MTPTSRGHHDTNVTVGIRSEWASHAPFGASGARSSFEPHRVALESPTGEVLEELRKPRASFASHTLETPWSALQLAYFAGCAMWTYLNTPFLLAKRSIVMSDNDIALDNAILREARNALRNYDFSADVVVSPLSESENKVYLIEDPAGDERFVMRVNSGRLAYHRPASIASELMWLMALEAESDVTVPSVLTARDGALVKTLNAPDLDKPRHASVYSFLPGIEPPKDNLMEGFDRLGEISAQIHLHAKNWTPPANFSRHSWSADTILDDQSTWGRWQDGVNITNDIHSLLDRLDQTVRKRWNALPKDREYFGLIHADLRLANLLVEGDKTSIIDFDDCGYSLFLYDLAGALSFLEERDDAPDLVNCWLEGYRRAAAIPPDLEAEIPTLIMLRRLQLIGWIGYQQYHLDFAREIGPNFTADTCRLAENYLREFG